MTTDNNTSQTLGRLEAHAESVTALLAEIRSAMIAQVGKMATTAEQIAQLEHRAAVTFKLISGTDGAGGMQDRIAKIESAHASTAAKLASTATALAAAEDAAKEQKMIFLKILATALGGSMAGGAGIAKFLALFSG